MNCYNTKCLLTAAWKSITPNVLFSSSTMVKSAVAVDKQALKTLRQATGYAIGNCRNALIEHNNDYDQALKWLNEQAVKEGWAKASKLQNRKTAQGLIGTVIEGNSVLMLEVLCETDFVARNRRFAELISKVSRAAIKNLPDQRGVQSFSGQNLNKTLYINEEPLPQLVASEIGNIGENIQISRALALTKPDDSILCHYIHAGGMEREHMGLDGCSLGKYAAAVQFLSLDKDKSHADIEADGNALAQHIVGMAPTSMGEWEDNSENVESVPESAENIDPDEEKRLLYQEFLLYPSYSVKTWLQERNIKVQDFVRMGVGESNS